MFAELLVMGRLWVELKIYLTILIPESYATLVLLQLCRTNENHDDTGRTGVYGCRGLNLLPSSFCQTMGFKVLSLMILVEDVTTGTYLLLLVRTLGVPNTLFGRWLQD